MATTILIADDEYFIRQRIKRIIPWSELNLILAGEAQNGVEVLEKLKNKPADIVLLDIRMPKMLGTEAALHIRENFPSTQVIILSGYNEFEYARSALKTGVSDYLLKPVDPAALRASIEKCMETIAMQKKVNAKLDSYDHLKHLKALESVRTGRESLQDFFAAYPQFASSKYSVYIGIYVLEDTPRQVLWLAKQLRAMGTPCEYFQESSHIYVIQAFFNTQDTLHLDCLLAQLAAQPCGYVFLAASQAFQVEESWGARYKEAIASLDHRYFYPQSKLFRDFQPRKQGQEKNHLVKLRQSVVSFLNMDDSKGLAQFIQDSFEFITQKKDIGSLYSFMNELFITYHIYYKVPGNLEGSISDFISSMLEDEHSLERLKETALHYGLQCIGHKKSAPSDISYCRKITAYIDQHYADPDLAVSAIAGHFQLNASYMGSLFKNVKDQSVLQYISKVRMEAAKNLLAAGSHSVSWVAAAVGYSDVFYFSKCFKRSFGYSPKEFARICQGEEG